MVSGREAACVLCHQRSGLGLTEGAVATPPVSGPALFENRVPPVAMGRLAPGMKLQDYSFRTRPPYDDALLARAIREGVNPAGVRLQYLMPHYELGERDMRALVAYLHTLSAQPSPGVEGGIVHFATIIAPGVEASRRDACLDVLHACFAEHPDWRLHVWTLEGEPASWLAQLRSQYARQPVFAAISGLGGDEWTPVERFCNAEGLPCLFPNVDVPGSDTPGWYSFYFFRGVRLEAAVLAQHLRQEHASGAIRRVVQVARAEGRGARGASALRQDLSGKGVEVVDRPFAGGKADLRALHRGDALVLWLDAADVAALTKREPVPPGGPAIFVSGLLGGLEDTPLAPAWKKAALMTYPFDPPARRQLRMQRNLRPWLAQHGLQASDERLQGNTLAACNVLSETMLRLREQYQRDHLVEWVENYPSAMGNAPAPEAFPRFSLGPGQRFSSKGAYLVRFVSPEGNRLEPARDEWIVP